MSEALRLAEHFDHHRFFDSNMQAAAAAELRSLHAENAELGLALARAVERINELEAELAEQARLNGMGSEREARLLAVNAELLEALKHAAECVQTNYLPDKCGHDWDDVIQRAEASK